VLLAACGAMPTATAAELGGLEFHGFFSQGYVKTSHNEYLVDRSQHGSFDLNEAALNASWQATDRLRLFTQIYTKNMWSGEHDIVDDGTYSNARAPTVTLDLAYAQYTARDWLGLRLGRIKQAYGLYNEVRDRAVARTSATLPQSVYDDRDREQNFAVDGGGLFGSVDLGGAGGLEYQAYVGKVEIPTDGRIFGQYATPDVGLNSNEIDLIYGASVFWTPPVDGLRLGFSYRESNGQVAGRATQTAS
jgi:hypothetical protein